MDIVRTKGSGTFDKTTKTWKLRSKKLKAQISVRKLSKRYGVEIPPTKRDSLPYWRRYLQELAEDNQAAKKAASPLQGRIRAIERIIRQLEAQGASTDDMRRLLDDAINTPHWSDDPDIPPLHPDMASTAELLGLGDDELGIRFLNSLIFDSKTELETRDDKHGKLKTEIEHAIEREKKREPKRWRTLASALNMFGGIVGANAHVSDVTVSHYREYLKQVEECPDWSDRTKYNRQAMLKTFLKRVEADHNLNYGFLRNTQYNLECPEGQKIQYSDKQIKHALKHATGNVRLSLLLGMNAGLYWSDIETITHENLQGDYLVMGRAKNKNKTKLQGTWKLWEETKTLLEAHLKNPTKTRKLEADFTAFVKELELPTHKALRKTIAQGFL